jgi:proline iminopeptidase
MHFGSGKLWMATARALLVGAAASIYTAGSIYAATPATTATAAPSTAAPAAGQSPPPLTRADVTSNIAEIRKIASENGIDELRAVPIGGIQQWLSIRGRDRRNPILLFIHGGPASPEMATSWIYQDGWEDYFTVVQWDQRGTGKTFTANDPTVVGPTISVERIESDAEEVVQYLRTTYHQRKIFVLGHSWGTILGLELAKHHPEWLYAYIGMGQVISVQENERLNYAFALKAAEAAGNQQALTQLRSIAPYPEADGSLPIPKVIVSRNWATYFGGFARGHQNQDYLANAKRWSPDYSDADLASAGPSQALSFPHLAPELKSVDLTKITELHCPVVLFLGKYDENVPSTAAAQWFEHLKAPSKRLVWFENSAHMMYLEEPGRVLVHLVEDVRPLAGKDSAGSTRQH